MDVDEYLTTDEVAALLRTPLETIYYWHKVGKGPRSIKIGRRRLYPRRGIQEFIAAAEAGDLDVTA